MAANFQHRLGAKVPNFRLLTTEGDMQLHDFIDKAKKYTILFSHPADYTPVCTTELGKFHQQADQIEARGANMIGLSCDSLENHLGWIQDILHRTGGGEKLRFPIIADDKREMAVALGMLDPNAVGDAGLPLPSRALFIFDKQKKLRASILYPASTGRFFNEVIRVLDSLVLTDVHKCATPVEWKQGERVVVVPNVSTEEARKVHGKVDVEDLPSKKEYLRFVDCPATAA